MPIRRKVCHIGTGFAVFLPKSWVTLLEEKSGNKLEHVLMEINTDIRIRGLTKIGVKK